MTNTGVEYALKEIADRSGGRLTPDVVLKAAKSRFSPLHDYFTWDDTEAAHQHRLHQARTLIRSVKIQFETTERVISTVAYVRDPEKPSDEQGYVSTIKLRSEEDNARVAIVNEFMRVNAALTRAKNIAAVLDMVDDIKELIDRVEKVSALIEHRV
jgi:hypothetical protein